MTITWYGHSCFKIDSPAGSLVLDPYADGFPPGLKLPPLEADFVLCSHSHKDHSNEQAVALTMQEPEYRIEQLCCWHDDVGGKKRGANVIHVISGGGFRVAHLGDVGQMLPDSQIKAIGHVDVLLIPVGGFYTIDAAAARTLADRIDAVVTIPMHYRGEDFGLAETDTVESFARLSRDVIYADSNVFEPKRGEAKKTVILKLVKY